jgi:hypothetical protein
MKAAWTDRLYDTDFAGWAEQTAGHLRRGEFDRIDIEALADEVESLGIRERRAAENRASVLLAHLLKWQHQPGKRSRSGLLTIEEQRNSLSELLEESPSLRSHLESVLPEKAWRRAVLRAARDTGFDRAHFGARCPYRLKDLLRIELKLAE